MFFNQIYYIYRNVFKDLINAEKVLQLKVVQAITWKKSHQGQHRQLEDNLQIEDKKQVKHFEVQEQLDHWTEAKYQ